MPEAERIHQDLIQIDEQLTAAVEAAQQVRGAIGQALLLLSIPAEAKASELPPVIITGYDASPTFDTDDEPALMRWAREALSDQATST